MESGWRVLALEREEVSCLILVCAKEKLLENGAKINSIKRKIHSNLISRIQINSNKISQRNFIQICFCLFSAEYSTVGESFYDNHPWWN